MKKKFINFVTYFLTIAAIIISILQVTDYFIQRSYGNIPGVVQFTIPLIVILTALVFVTLVETKEIKKQLDKDKSTKV